MNTQGQVGSFLPPSRESPTFTTWEDQGLQRWLTSTLHSSTAPSPMTTKASKIKIS